MDLGLYALLVLFEVTNGWTVAGNFLPAQKETVPQGLELTPVRNCLRLDQACPPRTPVRIC